MNFKNRCKDVFDYFCVTGNKLTYNEMYQAMLSLGISMSMEEQKEKEMEYTSSKGELKGWTFEEFVDLCENKCEMFKKSREDVINEFKKFDKEDDGYLTKEDFRKIFYDAQIEMKNNEMELILDVVDSKKNNKIDYYDLCDEILSFYTKENTDEI